MDQILVKISSPSMTDSSKIYSSLSLSLSVNKGDRVLRVILIRAKDKYPRWRPRNIRGTSS